MINAIVAIGKSGQLGLNGRLPWHDREDLIWFRRKTMGGVLICGVKTLDSLPKSVHEGRRVIAWTRENLESVIREVKAIESPVWVIGGAETYRVWAPHIDRWHIGRIDYDGPADTWFDPALISDLGLGPARTAANPITMPEGLHPDSVALVRQTAEAMAAKLFKSQVKYNLTNGWKFASAETAAKEGCGFWTREECLKAFHHHVLKGDPVDCINYLAFMLHHGWQTEAAERYIQEKVSELFKERDPLQGMIGHIMAAIPTDAAVRAGGQLRDVQKYIKDLHQEREDLEAALRSLMDWTVQNVDAPDCIPYNYATRLLRQFDAKGGTKDPGYDPITEALVAVRDRFFPKDQPERDRDEMWPAVNGALREYDFVRECEAATSGEMSPYKRTTKKGAPDDAR